MWRSRTTQNGGDLIEVDESGDEVQHASGLTASAADEPGADAQDDDAEDRAPQHGLLIPASMGLRFQVPSDLEGFTVTASWGTYQSFATGRFTKSEIPIRHYRRTPVEEKCSIRLAELRPGNTKTISLQGDVCLRVDRYDDTQFGRILIEIALCNDRVTPRPIPVSMWMFQTKLRVDAGGDEVFLPVRDALKQDRREEDDELSRLQLQYRNRLEYAIGRTCSVDWVVREGARRATEVSTTWLPVAEIPQTRARSITGALLSMDALSTATPDELRSGLEPLISGYGKWLDEQDEAAPKLPEHLAGTAEGAISEARIAHQRLLDGLEFLTTNAEALRCFRFMNSVMRDQQYASEIVTERSADSSLSADDARQLVHAKGQAVASWRPFQLAFILMQLRALTESTTPRRSVTHSSRVELLFFPTGGGKTEAYLGLAAFTFAIRRHQGVVESADGPLDGRSGVGVLMRYTLRLLTAQQFQRAAALVCAAELRRRRDEPTWGTEPFRIGLWVGTAVSPKRFEEAREQVASAKQHGAYRPTALQLQRCPWCGTEIKAANITAEPTLRRLLVYCGDELARCPFSKGGGVPEGLPVLTVDEEIYRLAPTFVIATVDKFARLAREGQAASLFGYVRNYCGRHGYVHPDYEPCAIKTDHRASGGYPSAAVRPVQRLRPPDLIIQDELHLITGALGTSVGLFEVAVEVLSSWQKPDGQPVRPLLVASTATVRNAYEQVRGLYGRGVDIFPSQVLDVADTYFSQELPIDRDNPGRRYIGVSAQGVRLASSEIRIAEVLLLAGQLLFDRADVAADPYMTLVGYFNTIRELAGMARYVADDVQTRVKRPRQSSGFPSRLGTNFGRLNLGELTSRVASSEVSKALSQLGTEFDPKWDTTAANRRRIDDFNSRKTLARRTDPPYDVMLATSMLQVGVDVQRLGLMLVVGQPKNTAEYIQASSRIGRDATNRPGLVVALGNWARPRDLAHFEQFRHYHETFYSQVESLSVTPYSATSLDRGIDSVLVSAARVAQASHPGGLSPERHAWRIRDLRSDVEALVERVKARIDAATQSESHASQRAAHLLANRIDRWDQRDRYAQQRHQELVYERTGKGNEFLPLITSPESAKAAAGDSQQAPFVIANSMREVQPEINVLVSPLPGRLVTLDPEDAPEWSLPSKDES